MRMLGLLVLILIALPSQAAIVTQTIKFEAGNFICSTYPNPCPAIPEAISPENVVRGSFTVTYDNDDFGAWYGTPDAFDMTIAGHTYELTDVAFQFRGSCSDMYAGICNPFGPTFSVGGLNGGASSIGSYLHGTNDFAFGWGGPLDANGQWTNGSLGFTYDGALFAWSTSSSGQSNPDGYFVATLVPIPAAVWLFGSALALLARVRQVRSVRMVIK